MRAIPALAIFLVVVPAAFATPVSSKATGSRGTATTLAATAIVRQTTRVSLRWDPALGGYAATGTSGAQMQTEGRTITVVAP